MFHLVILPTSGSLTKIINQLEFYNNKISVKHVFRIPILIRKKKLLSSHCMSGFKVVNEKIVRSK